MNKTSFKGPIDYRFGDWGPGYLHQVDELELGVVALRPGDLIDNHYHEHCTETFIVIEGGCTLWINQSDQFQLETGDIVSSPANEQHCLRNDTDSLCRFIFLKTPGSPGDTIKVDWTPEP